MFTLTDALAVGSWRLGGKINIKDCDPESVLK